MESFSDIDGAAKRTPARAFDVAATTFPIGRRGYEPSQVTWFLQGIAEDLADHERRNKELADELTLVRRELDVAGRIDESTVAQFLGEESARLLTAARDTANDLAQRAEGKAAAVLAAAEAEAAKLRRDAEIDTNRQRKESEARSLATVEEADERSSKVIGDAEAQRRRVLVDLARRRDQASAQIQSLMVGRDSLTLTLRNIEADVRAMTSDLEDFTLQPAAFVNLTPEILDEVVNDPAASSTISRGRSGR